MINKQSFTVTGSATRPRVKFTSLQGRDGRRRIAGDKERGAWWLACVAIFRVQQAHNNTGTALQSKRDAWAGTRQLQTEGNDELAVEILYFEGYGEENSKAACFWWKKNYLPLAKKGKDAGLTDFQRIQTHHAPKIEDYTLYHCPPPPPKKWTDYPPNYARQKLLCHYVGMHPWSLQCGIQRLFWPRL